jgi:RNA recognition motif. (a.k.a. RRM, RBD, or RNP domain)
LESIRVLPEKSCVFLSFLDGATAAAFHADATIKKLSLHGQELKIGWGKPSPVPSQVALAISQSNASRNVYLGGLDDGTTEEQLRDDLSRFGLIDQVKIVRDKNIGFVHFLSISVATKARPLLCLYLSHVLMLVSFQGCEHTSHRTRVGRKAGQLR